MLSKSARLLRDTLSPFLLVTVSALSPVLSPFLLVICFLWSPASVRLVSLCLPFLLVTVSAWSPFCPPSSPFLSAFLLVTAPALSPFCLRSCLPSSWLLCPSCLLFPFVSLLVGPCVLVVVCVLSPFCFLLSPFLSLFFLLVSHVSKNGLENASLLSPLFGVYGGAILLPVWTAASASNCRPLLLNLFHLSPSLDCCVRLALPTSAFQSFSFVSQSQVTRIGALKWCYRVLAYHLSLSKHKSTLLQGDVAFTRDTTYHNTY